MSEETTIARLRADLAASQATAKRLAKKVGEAIDRSEFYAVLARTAADEYGELRASIDQPDDEPGASSHASAVIHGQWLVLGAKDRAKDRARVQRAEAFVAGLKRDGVVIPSTAPVRVISGDDGIERDEPEHDIECTCTVPLGWRGILHTVGCPVAVRRRAEANGIDRTAAGCATAAQPLRCGDEYCELHGCTRPGDCRGNDDQTDGYHGGDTELAADGVLDDPRMGGEYWLHPSNLDQPMRDAWPGLWELEVLGQRGAGGKQRVTVVTSRDLDDYLPRCGGVRPLRFPHQNLDTGAIESRYMTEEHFERVEDWEWSGHVGLWSGARHNRRWAFKDVSLGSSTEQWRPVGWLDVELSADDLEANIDKGLRMSLDAGAKAVAAYDAAITKYSPDMRDLVGRIVKLEATRANEQAIAVGVDALGVTVHETARQLTVALDRVGRMEADWVTRAPKTIPTPGGLFGICEVTTPEDLNGIEYVEWRASTESSELQIVSAQPLRKGVGVWRPLSDVSQHIARCMFEHYRGLCDRMAKLEGVEPEESPNPLLDGPVPVRADATHSG